MISPQMLLLVAIAVVSLWSCSAYQVHSPRQLCGRTLFRPAPYSKTTLSARLANKQDEDATQSLSGKPDDDEFMSIPYKGLVGYEPGSLFDKPLELFDPAKNTDDLPGEDGSPEKIAAIQSRIQARVEQLKSQGEWVEGDEFGKDPLRSQPIFTTMAQQLQACRPFETVGELGLNYLLVLATTLSLSVYLVFLRESLDGIISWYVKTDFDSDFFSNLLGSS